MPAELAKPEWFPLDFDSERGALLMIDATLERLGDANFLDRRLGIAASSATVVPVREMPVLPYRPVLLFHTSFCGSTLLARSLHAPPMAVALKEPAVLLSIALAELRKSGQQTGPDARLLPMVLGLLGRPWATDGTVLVKPTNQVNRLLPSLVRATGKPALLLYSSLEEFLLSCFKKLPAAERPIRWMAQFLLPDTALADRLGLSRAFAPNFVESCVLAWYAQMEWYAAALDDDGGDRLRTLDMDALLDRPVRAVEASATWLGLEGALMDLPTRVQRAFSQDAKRRHRKYSAARREQEKRKVREHCGPVIRNALQWAERIVAPAARIPVRWKPLMGA